MRMFWKEIRTNGKRMLIMQLDVMFAVFISYLNTRITKQTKACFSLFVPVFVALSDLIWINNKHFYAAKQKYALKNFSWQEKKKKTELKNILTIDSKVCKKGNKVICRQRIVFCVFEL